MHHAHLFAAAAVAAMLASTTAAAQHKQVASREGAAPTEGGHATDVGADGVTLEAPPPPSAEPYAASFLLRGVSPGNGARFDTTNAPFVKEGAAGLVSTMMLSGSYRVTEGLGVGAKLGLDRVSMNGADTKVGFLNPTVSAMYGLRFGRYLRLAPSLSLSIPVGSGGGNGGDPDLVAAHKLAALARSAQENSMFSVNDMAATIGLDFAYVGHGLTVQLGAAIAPIWRVRGDLVQSDVAKVNSTYGLSLGYFVLPQLSLGTELRYQVYVSTPSAVAKDPSARQNMSLAGGARGHIPLGKGAFLRPGLSYGHGLVGPVATNGYHLVQVDLPVSF